MPRAFTLSPAAHVGERLATAPSSVSSQTLASAATMNVATSPRQARMVFVPAFTLTVMVETATGVGGGSSCDGVDRGHGADEVATS